MPGNHSDNRADSPRVNGREDTGTSVCIVAPVHDWDDVRVFQKEARTLADAGYRVSLIARSPSKLMQHGVDVIPATGSSGGRFLRFLSLPIVGAQALRQGAAIYHMHNPDTLPLVVMLRVFGKKVIYDTHEDYARRILIRDWIPGPLRRMMALLVSRFEIAVSFVANASIATQRVVADRLKGRVLLLGNPPRISLQLIEQVAAEPVQGAGAECDVRAVYIGRINASRGLFEMVDALEIVNRSARVRLWLVGTADPRVLDLARSKPGWNYVDYVSQVPQEAALAYVQHADVGLVVLRDVGDYATSEPNKLYEYLAFGKPFIASAFEEWKRKVGSTDTGWFVAPGSAREIADVLLDISDNGEIAARKGERGRQLTQEYNWEAESGKLLGLYAELVE